MWSRLRLDIAWADLTAGLAACCLVFRRDCWLAQCRQTWSADGDALICTSVRSGFDLLLQSLELPAGSEIAFTAITIPDMMTIAREHGLQPVPVDLCRDSCSPSRSALARAVGPKTRMIVVAHLFGLRLDMSPVMELARQHGKLLVVEDCAQAFAGAGYRGHPASDVAMFSFGPIKTATALGGGVIEVRDPHLLSRMRQIQAAYPTQSRFAYLRRYIKYAALKLLTVPRVLGIATRCAECCGLDAEATLAGIARNYTRASLLSQLRIRPSAPLLAMLDRRWRKYNGQRARNRTRKGQDLTGYLDCPPSPLDSDALPIEDDVGWLFPLLTDDDHVVSDLRQAGYDATNQSRLKVVPAPANRADLEPLGANGSMDRMIIVPCYGEMPDEELKRMAEIIRGRVSVPDRSCQKS